MIPMKESSTIGLPSNLKHSPKPEALPSFFSYSIGVPARKKVAAIPIII